MNSHIGDNIKIIIILVLGIIIATAIYSNGVTSRQEARFEQGITKAKDKEKKLNSCLNGVDVDHWEDWKLNCSSNFLYFDNGEIKSCSVPNHIAKFIKSRTQENKANCIKIYK